MTKTKANKIKRCLERNGSYRLKDGSQISVRETHCGSREYILYGKDHGLFHHNVIDVCETIDEMLDYLSDD